MHLRDEEAIAINCHMGFSRAEDNSISISESFRFSPLAWIIHVADEAATFMLDRITPQGQLAEVGGWRNFIIPVFYSEEEMGEYGEGVSPVPSHFVHAMALAGNNEKPVKGIVINAFTESFVVPREQFDLIADLDSLVEEKEDDPEN